MAPQPLRILHVIDSLNLGGAQTVLCNLAAHRDREAFHVEALSLHGPGPYAERLAQHDVPTSHLCASKFDPRLPLRLIAELRRRRPHVLHLHLVMSCLLGERLRPFFPRQIRLVSHIQNLFGRHDSDRYQDWLEHAVYRRSDAVIACGASVPASMPPAMRESLGPRLRVIPNGVEDRLLAGRDEARRQRARADLGIAPEVPLLLSASRLSPQKNLLYGLEVAAALARRVPGLRYVLAGDGPDEDALRRRAAELGLNEVVTFLGYRRDVPELLQAADLFLMPSLHEGLTLSLVESLGAELLVAVTPFPTMEDVLGEAAPPQTIPFDNAEAAAECVAALLTAPPEERDALRRLGLQRARAHFSASAMTRAVEALYRELAPPASH